MGVQWCRQPVTPRDRTLDRAAEVARGLLLGAVGFWVLLLTALSTVEAARAVQWVIGEMTR